MHAVRSRARFVRRAAAAAALAFVALGATSASAHPLGNFSINHSHNLEIRRDLIVDRAIVDFAEIPTAQQAEQIDLDSDGRVSAVEFDERGRAGCAELVEQVVLQVDGVATRFTVAASSFTHEEGQAGLPTGRLECRFEAPVQLSATHSIGLDDSFEADRVGWHEITATGIDVELVDSSVPTSSPTDQLRRYPIDLLDSPLDVRSVQLEVAPGASTTATEPTSESPARSSIFDGGPLSGVVDRVSDRFDDLVGRRDLTLGVGLLAVALAMILGASHALLPGHGKTVMAAYIAGRQGSSRDAVVVGATVTATHTGGVLLLGLALTLSSSFAGETALAWLGVASGTIIAVLGISLLVNAARHRTAVHGHRHIIGARQRHGHDHGHHPHDDHPHDDHTHDQDRHADGRSHAPARISVRAHQQRNDARRLGGGIAVLAAPAVRTPKSAVVVRRTPTRTDSSSTPLEVAPSPTREVSRRGLIGMGIAGGLVPSPSALIVLLSAIALGRTAFGVVLVIGYGLGMAATLTLAGLLLVRVRDRLQARRSASTGRASRLAQRWTAFTPYGTAALVLVVGLGIALRGAGGL